MQRGWQAKGILKPLWREYPGGRDALARKVGTTGSVLSSINTGERNLGIDLGERLARELGVSLSDLGGPTPAEVAAESVALADRVAALEAMLATILRSRGETPDAGADG